MSAARDPPVGLVVEDERATREPLRALLEEAGYEVLLAGDGPAALAVLETARPDRVTLDLELPGLPGRAVLRALRRREALRGARVVIVSGQAAIPPDLHRLAQACVRKPFEVDELLAVVRRLAPRAGRGD
jgi:two-component system, OmpR family, phosphate regulon response regulator PhoB